MKCTSASSQLCHEEGHFVETGPFHPETNFCCKKWGLREGHHSEADDMAALSGQKDFKALISPRKLPQKPIYSITTKHQFSRWFHAENYLKSEADYTISKLIIILQNTREWGCIDTELSFLITIKVSVSADANYQFHTSKCQYWYSRSAKQHYESMKIHTIFPTDLP